MFDTGLRALTDSEVVAEIAAGQRNDAVAAARRLTAVAELVRRRCGDDDRAHWACDSWDAAAAEVSAALGMSHGRASGQMDLGLSLFRRLPKVAALFSAGQLGYRVVAAIINRTDLVLDADAAAAIDAEIAGLAHNWGPLSAVKLEQAVDAIVDRHDPGALRRTREAARSRDVKVGGRDDDSGTVGLWGRLYGTDAAVLDRRLAQMAHAVCDEDPRTIAQRRADALGALAAGSQTLACQCPAPECASEAPTATAGVVIHILAQSDPAPAAHAEPGGTEAGSPAGLGGQTDPHLSGLGPTGVRYTRGTPLSEYLRQPRAAQPDPVCPPGRGLIIGGGLVPAPLLAELIRAGATLQPVIRPPAEPEPGYRPSEALAEFVRARDLTCRFPGCDVPAQLCDIEHAIPWPEGPTHASNLRCECRKDHLLKTFWTGRRGWTDQQFPDGTIRWTSPTGDAYTTVPGSWLLFPSWDTATAPLPQTARPAPDQPGPERERKMPKRRRSRLAERARRIRRERALNDAYVVERNKPPPF